MPESFFHISADIVKRVQDTVGFYDPFMGEYFRAVNASMREQHPFLFFYMRDHAQREKHLFAYALGGVIAYDTLTRQLDRENRTIELSQSDIDNLRVNVGELFSDARMRDFDWINLELQAGKETESPLSQLFSFINKCSPELADNLIERVSTEEPQARISMLRGILDAFLPFYSKLEAQYFETDVLENAQVNRN